MEERHVTMRCLQRASWQGCRQSGLALYLMLIVAIFVSVQLMSAQLSGQKNHYIIERQQRLKFAKENLKALAVNYMDIYGPTGAGPGHLPCPNQKVPNDSRSSLGPDTPCRGEYFVIGRLPMLVGIEQHRRVLNYQSDQYDAQNALWYIVSSRFVNSPFRKVNGETLADLSFNGLHEVLAVVLDSGPALERQRDSRPSSNADSYLEIDINDNEINLANDSNDRFLILTKNELMPLTSTRVSDRVSKWLIEYRHRRCPSDQALEPCFPFAAPFSGGACTDGLLEGWLSVEQGPCSNSLFEGVDLEGVPVRVHWFIRNRWFKHVRYKVEASCLESPDRCEIIISTVVLEERLVASLSIVPMLSIEP